MAWRVEFSDPARRALRKLNPHIQDQITHYLNNRIGIDADPRRFGKVLSGNMAGVWRYRSQPDHVPTSLVQHSVGRCNAPADGL